MRFQRIVIIYITVAATLAALVPAHAETSQEATFLAEKQTIMDKMMAGMDIKATVPPPRPSPSPNSVAAGAADRKLVARLRQRDSH